MISLLCKILKNILHDLFDHVKSSKVTYKTFIQSQDLQQVRKLTRKSPFVSYGHHLLHGIK